MNACVNLGGYSEKKKGRLHVRNYRSVHRTENGIEGQGKNFSWLQGVNKR